MKKGLIIASNTEDVVCERSSSELDSDDMLRVSSVTSWHRSFSACVSEKLNKTVIVSGGSAIVRRGNTVNTGSADHFVRDPMQSENIDIAPTVAWLLGLNIQNSDFPDAGGSFQNYGDGVTRAGFDGRILTEAFNVDPLVTTPSSCGIISN